ncbi:hypothetical protein HRR83_008810 [Exophiala dermatitidis]|uniref:Uncharacterized protein n=2 Tax=Exophiala dermatitidis TaxID=5970 RepID=H6BXD3_EXODN|nr:uncharacterized protein HMPREF1120_03504 [Exophiala dermatitidis NIH/UT8656]KAJ4503708.1 hypothetical protein HRR73_009013 [Exophiala dermatitidis]EHY55364.1 hypothetical protein HMPREF1120_03504 [Exophiala dermatitidis NIH/UT8656]KAJ4506244.1 hypothetical protein HRR75_007099 [Exophiala dermatitidis]KAJ4508338.1 hypothetical protein HRR74_007737 [Exophiala dermatitidis]KAJ4533444.1 hypothetical protein HRR77_008606 [Exophiala dermatitidis]
MSPAVPAGAPLQITEPFVPIPDDLISEESDFHGDSDSASYYSKLAASFNPARYWAIHDWNTQVIAVRGKKAWKAAAELKAKKDAEEKGIRLEDAAEAKHRDAQRDVMAQTKPKKIEDEEARASPSPAPTASPTPSASPDHMNLDPNPLPAALEMKRTTQASGHGDQDADMVDTKIMSSDEIPDGPNPHRNTPPRNFHEGRWAAKQLSESIEDFLARLPPSTTTLSTAKGPWIWIANPYPRKHKTSNGAGSTKARGDSETGDTGDIPTFKQLGSRLLDAYRSRKSSLESQHPEKPPGSITRMLAPDRVTLESSILELAKSHRVTSGKWMMFVPTDDIDRVWAIVARGVWEGKLGTSAKVAVATAGEEEEQEGQVSRSNRYGAQQNQRLICVYTYDFSDRVDVKRVLLGMKDLGLLNPPARTVAAAEKYGFGTAAARGRGRGGSNGPVRASGLITIYYKCDAYTWLDIANGNEFKIKASLYCSKDFLE